VCICDCSWERPDQVAQQLQRVADHSPPSNAEVKNGWRYTSPNPYAFMSSTGQFHFILFISNCHIIHFWYSWVFTALYCTPLHSAPSTSLPPPPTIPGTSHHPPTRTHLQRTVYSREAIFLGQSDPEVGGTIISRNVRHRATSQNSSVFSTTPLYFLRNSAAQLAVVALTRLSSTSIVPSIACY
jgi:hypothetical protein